MYLSIAERRFPSPTGSSYFSMLSISFWTAASLVSVPYGVFVFLNDAVATSKTSILIGFRPLRGLRISQYRQVGDVEWQAGQFPSPTGSSYFSIELSLLIESLENLVSVPYGVFVFLNDVLAFLGCLRVAFVSVPYGVFVFLNTAAPA